MSEKQDNQSPVGRLPSAGGDAGRVPPCGPSPSPPNAASGDAAYNTARSTAVGRVPPHGFPNPNDPPPRRLRRLHRVWPDRDGNISYLLTICVDGRTRVLDNEETFQRLVAFLLDSPQRYRWFGRRFVIMPDHLHIIARMGHEAVRLGQWIKALKAVVGGLRPREDGPVRVPGLQGPPNAASGDAAYNTTRPADVGRLPPAGGDAGRVPLHGASVGRVPPRGASPAGRLCLCHLTRLNINFDVSMLSRSQYRIGLARTRRAMKKTNFDRYLEEQMQDPAFAARFKQAGEAWDVALQIAALREQAGLSQRELARKLKTSQQQISRLESPGYEGHSLSTLRRVARVLHARVRVVLEAETTGKADALAEGPTLSRVKRTAAKSA